MLREPLWITVYENLKQCNISVGLAVLSSPANTGPCSVDTVPPQKPRKADEELKKCHRDCTCGETEHLECSASQYPLSFCVSVILFIKKVKKTQSTVF